MSNSVRRRFSHFPAHLLFLSLLFERLALQLTSWSFHWSSFFTLLQTVYGFILIHTKSVEHFLLLFTIKRMKEISETSFTVYPAFCRFPYSFSFSKDSFLNFIKNVHCYYFRERKNRKNKCKIFSKSIYPRATNER